MDCLPPSLTRIVNDTTELTLVHGAHGMTKLTQGRLDILLPPSPHRRVEDAL